MGDVRAALAAMACFAAFARGLRFARAGRPSTGGRTGDLQRRCESEPRASGASSQDKKAMDTAVDKARQYCHAKGEKLLVTSAVGNTINFQCLAEGAVGQH